MLSLLLHTFTLICFLTARVSAVTTETVVGVAGRRVKLPCLSEAVSQRGVEVCWGRGEPSLFTCHNTVINAAGDQVSYRKSYRYSISSSSSLSIYSSRSSDAGFYHCRVQLPGLFNDQTSTVHLIIINPRSVVSETSERLDNWDAENLNAPHTTTGFSGQDVTRQIGSDVTGEDTTGAMVALVQSSVQQQQQPVDSLQSFIGNTVRVSFIVFIPALLLTAAYRFWRTNQRPETDRRLNQSEGEEVYSSV
ncbi:hepatitis A virus cellular receptor 1-like isoform X2 [Sparus aurata]|uniref:hepatitis A virus cellular receptor 1-like isoform X2 n=1 Tax=Sparus aurata TaxID=8175 RepID=UPI0011C11735|nr:hepatitis A virus cellular receptor 1-like isoform X2 [Sparus aurata]